MVNGHVAATLRATLFLLILGPAGMTSAQKVECPPPVLIRTNSALGHSHYLSHGIAPPGSSLHAILAVQVANGRAAQMVLYRYDFLPQSEQLKPRGHFQLAKIRRRLVQTPFPLLIEPTGVPELDEARRLHVLETLGESLFAIAEERVIVAQAHARWLDGEDAMLLHPRLLHLSAGDTLGVGAPPTTAPALGVPPIP